MLNLTERHRRPPSQPPERDGTVARDGGGGPGPARGRRRRPNAAAPAPAPHPRDPRRLLRSRRHPPDFAADALAEALELRDRTTDARVGSRVDFIFNALDFARDAGLTPAQTVAVHEVGQAMLDACAVEPGPSFVFADAESLFQSTILPKVAAEPDREGGQFSVTDVRAVSDYFAKGFFQHFSLWRFVWSEEQEMDKHETFKRVEVAFPARPLPDFLTEQANEERLAKEAEEAEAARVAAEEAAKEAEEADGFVIEEEDANGKRRRREYEASRRRSRTRWSTW